MKMDLPAPVLQAVRMLNDSGFEAYVIGGAVRNRILNNPVHDYDLTTSALPGQVKQVFSRYRTIDTGIRHGTVTVIISRMHLEITTYRTETSYRDHRHPDAVAFTSLLRDDCARRDFTINAMAYHPDEGLIDYFGGYDDIRSRIIRTVNDPRQRFEEDALRILRAVRFASELGFDIEKQTAQALLEQCGDLQYVSKERIIQELGRILTGACAPDALKDFRCVFAVFIDGLTDEEQWQQLLRQYSRCSRNLNVRLALLLNSQKKNAERILHDLKYPNEVTDAVRNMLALSGMPLSSRTDIRKLLSRLKVPFETYLSYRSAADPDISTAEVLSLYRRIEEDRDCVSIRGLAVDGNDLREAGLQGKQIGTALQTCLNAVMEDRAENTKDALLKLLKDQNMI